MADPLDLTTLDKVKEWLTITTTASDSLLSRLITAVSLDFRNETMRPEIAPAADYTETDLKPSDRTIKEEGIYFNRSVREVFLRRYPINSIASVTINDFAVSPVVDLSTDSGWWFDVNRAPEDRQKIVLVGQWYPVFAIPWTWMPNIVIAYNAGYETVPPAIEQAVIEWIAFRRGQSQLQGADQSGGGVRLGSYEEITPASELMLKIMSAPLPSGVQRVIDQYRRHSL